MLQPVILSVAGLVAGLQLGSIPILTYYMFSLLGFNGKKKTI